jgi:hypothetical protein
MYVMTPYRFTTLKDAIREALRWDEELEFPAIVTREEDGSYTLYGTEINVYDTTKNEYAEGGDKLLLR